MPASRQFITFQCATHRLALPADSIRRLAFAKKEEALLTQKECAIGSFRTGEELLHAVEFFDTAAPGQRVPLIQIDTAEGRLTIRATKILGLHRTDQIQPLPLYTHDTVASCFPLGFRYQQHTYYVLDEQALLKIAPQALSKATDESKVSQTARRPIPVQQKYWLSYQLNLAHQEKTSGRIELEANENVASLGFTAGHLTYARTGKTTGRDALHAIAAEQTWWKAQWNDNEINADHNITESLPELLAALKLSYAQ